MKGRFRVVMRNLSRLGGLLGRLYCRIAIGGPFYQHIFIKATWIRRDTYLIPGDGEQVLGQFFQEESLDHTHEIRETEDKPFRARVFEDKLHNLSVCEY